MLATRLKALDELQQRAYARARVGLGDRFGRVVAHAVLAAHEEHRHIGDRLHRLTVVPRAGGQPAHAHAFASYRALQLLDEPRCARSHPELLDALDLASEPALRG